MKQIHKLSWALLFILAVVQMTGCKKTTKEPDVISSFTFAINATNFKLVTFTSTSQNFKTLSWDFGDGTAAVTGTTNDPVTHTYAALGSFVVKLTATSPGGVTDVFASTVAIADPNAYLTMLVGDVSKTWKLIRSVTTKRYPLEVGPWDHSTIWWATGLGNDEIANRPCMFNDEWTFTRDGLKMTYDPKGDYWLEGGIFLKPDNICGSTSTMKGVNNEDLSAWKGGTFTFTLTPGTATTQGKLKVDGKGAFVGFFKLGSGQEVNLNASATPPVPIAIPSSITYNVVKLVDATVDTLIVEGQYKWDATDGGYWRFVLVHYDNAADEPALPGPKPVANFSYILDHMTITLTNTSTNSTSYLWDFGDGTTSTAQNPTHTYAADGLYTVTLTATNSQGNSVATQSVATSVLTADNLLGSWKVKVAENSIFVGPGLGSNAWWVCPKANLDGTNAGTADDWSCMADDEFIFSAGGVFEYKTNGGSRNDGYMGTPNGCWSDAQILASPGAAFSSSHHTYTFVPATATTRPIITLTNGDAGKVPFLGFYKGYYGGENTDGTKPANGGFTTNKYEVMLYGNSGGKQVMIVSVDLSPLHDGSTAWSATLEK